MRSTEHLTAIRRALLVTILAAAVVGLAAPPASAEDTAWQKAHPRREQVNNRLANQNKRIRQERQDGDLTGAQAAQLHRDDHQIRTEEKLMARQNGGHITRQEQRTLNAQENQVSRQIGP